MLRLCGHSMGLPKWSELLLEMFAGVQDPLGSTLSQQSISAYPPGGHELTHGPSGFWSHILTRTAGVHRQAGEGLVGTVCVCVRVRVR